MSKGSPRVEFQSTYNVSRETLERLACYESLLIRWQRSLNLVGSSTLSEVWHRHFADSAQLIAMEPDARRWADLGSGAGFPGLVISILQAELEPGEVHLIEVDQRKCAFLREVIRGTGASAYVHNCRAEEVLHNLDVQIVTSRALADLSRLIDLSMPVLRRGGRGIFLKGRGVARELTEVAAIPNIQFDLMQSRTDPASHVVRVRRLNEHECTP